MATQLLIYEQAVPVSRQRHGDCAVMMSGDYGFARNTNSVPLMAAEFNGAFGDYAIVFAGNAESVMPAVILGVRDRENAYLGADGKWNAEYIPAFIRRYPYVFTAPDDAGNFTLCIDEGFAGFNREGQGERLFDEAGEQTQYLKNVLNFLNAYQTQFQLTKTFCDRLRDLEILEPMQAQFRLGADQTVSLSGFFAVSRDKLKALSGEQLSKLAANDSLELIYLHLLSIRNFNKMVARIQKVTGAAAKA